MTELSDGMRRLIEPWTLEVTVDDAVRTQHFPPLVDILRGQLVPGMEGGGGGGSPATRNILDVGSLDMLEHVQNVTRAWLQEWGVSRAGELKLDLRAFWDRLNTLHRTGDMDDTTFEYLAAYPDAWAASAWDLIDPPKQIPLRGTECPKCGTAKVANSEGALSDPLNVVIRPGHLVTAQCRADGCAAVWVGRDGLVNLGRAVGVEIDMEKILELVAEIEHGMVS